MKILKAALVVFGAIIIIGITVFNVMSRSNEKQLNEIVISDVDMTQISDGVYTGSCDITAVSAEVEVTVVDSKIKDIKILKHDNGKGSSAESITSKVSKAQSLKVETVSGATASSKVILKAIQNALCSGINK